jgi:hypothetical protein
MATYQEITAAVTYLTKQPHDKAKTLLEQITEAAARYWEGIRGDFCAQHYNGEVIVFGSSNRLIYTPHGGFRPDRSYCTEQFLANCDRLGPYPGRGE